MQSLSNAAAVLNAAGILVVKNHGFGAARAYRVYVKQGQEPEIMSLRQLRQLAATVLDA